jgi:hypothetical protein
MAVAIVVIPAIMTMAVVHGAAAAMAILDMAAPAMATALGMVGMVVGMVVGMAADMVVLVMGMTMVMTNPVVVLPVNVMNRQPTKAKPNNDTLL